jgi:hypothetical protein
LNGAQRLNGLNGLNFRKKEQSKTPAEFEKEFFQNGRSTAAEITGAAVRADGGVVRAAL